MAFKKDNQLPMLVVGILLIAVSQAIILPKPLRDPNPTDGATVPDLSEVPVPVKTVPIPASIAATQTYKGATEVLVNGDFNRVQFYITFSKFTEGCSYLSCYYGWVQNSTVSGGDTIQGYPKGNDAIKPVFEFKTNSKKDFVIVRNPSLADHYVNMIEIGCEFFEPTIKGVSQKTDGTSSSFSSAKAKFGGGSDLEYIFIPDSDFQRLAPQDTASLDPALLSKSGAQSKVSGLAAPSNLLTASLSRQAPLQDVETTQSVVNQRVTVDGDYNIVRRSRVADVDIPSDSLGEGQKQLEFVSNVKILFDKSGSSPADINPVKKIIDSFRNSGASFSSARIQAQRSEPSKVQFTDEKFNISEIPQEARGAFPSSQKIESLAMRGDGLTICDGTIVIPTQPVVTTPPPPPKPVKPIKPTPIKPYEPDIIGQDLPLSPFDPGFNPLNRRLLFESNLFTYQKNLFNKNVLGRSLSVDVLVEGTVIDNTYIRFKGTLLYSIFGNSRSIQAFNFVKKIVFSYEKSYNMFGGWSFNIYLRFPPPVSFMGINFGFGVFYNVRVGFFIKGSPQIQNCLYNLEIGATAGTTVILDASAALRIIVVEGGVYISGTLVSLDTDPKFALAFHLRDLRFVTTHVTWYLYINAFFFHWGFFIRWRKWWGGWGDRRELGHWAIGNGYSTKIVILKN